MLPCETARILDQIHIKIKVMANFWINGFTILEPLCRCEIWMTEDVILQEMKEATFARGHSLHAWVESLLAGGQEPRLEDIQGRLHYCISCACIFTILFTYYFILVHKP